MLGDLPPLLSPLHGLIVGGTLLEYNIHHLFNAGKGGPDWSPHARTWHLAIAALGVLLCIPVIPHLTLKLLGGCAVMALLAFAYSTPLLPFRYKARLKDYGFIKIHVLTGVWVMVGTVLPALYWDVPLGEYWMELIIRSLLIFPLCIAFDIRDVQADHERGIHTLPNTLGVAAAYRAIHINLIIYFVFGIIRSFYRYTYSEIIVYAVGGIAAYATITISRKNPHPFVYLALIDGVMLLYGTLQALI
jgi:4-hydroxybenzoate polyprenyltransferase